MTINTTILNEICRARNLFKHETKGIPTENIITNIKNNLKEIIMIHYKKHEQNNTLFNLSRKICNKERSMLNENDTFHFNF